MSKPFSQLGRPGSAESKRAGSRKQLQGNSSCMLRIGERLMRAGSEGNLLQNPLLSQGSVQAAGPGKTWKTQPAEARGPGKTPLKDLNQPSYEKSSSPSHFISPLLQRKHHMDKSQIYNQCVASVSSQPGTRSTLPRNFTSNCSSDSELDRLIMRHSLAERKKEAFLDHLRQKYPHHAVFLTEPRDQGENPILLESTICSGIMAETNLLPCNKVRASPKGMLYLQYGDETKQVQMPGEISSLDMLRALFVAAFPQLLTMKALRSPNMAIYIKDPSHNVYSELDDIRNITSHSCLKLYPRDAAQLVNLVHPEGRISKEILYGNHSPVHRSSQSSRVSLHSLQGSMSPPMVRSMPTSPSKKSYGGRVKQTLTEVVDESKDRLLSSRRSRSLYSSSSAILERRDVRPDSHFYSQHQEGVNISTSRSSTTQSTTSDVLDYGIPVGLRQYRATVKPLFGYGDTLEQQTLNRQKSRKHADSKTPPLSPPRVDDVQLTECQFINGVISPERMSPFGTSRRQSGRGHSSTSSASSVFLDSPVSHSAGYSAPFSVQSERMKAMEQQIANLAGLVHHALSAGVDISGIEEFRCDIPGNGQHGLLAENAYSSAPLALLPPPSCTGLQQKLASVTRSMSELRLQLKELRRLQLSNQQAVNSMLRMAGQELVHVVCDRLAQAEEAVHSRRADVEEERIHYQTAEDRILRQLSRLEEFVERMQANNNPVERSITLSDVEEGAINLRRVGEELSIIKGEFPELQMKMRSMLRPELEALKFLKEEPMKMDSMLKRVKALTETLSSLHRCVTESSTVSRPVHVDVGQGPRMRQSPHSSPKPQPRSSVRNHCSSETSHSPMISQRKDVQATSGPGPPPTPVHRQDLTQVAKSAEREAPEENQTPAQTQRDLSEPGTRRPVDPTLQASTDSTLASASCDHLGKRTEEKCSDKELPDRSPSPPPSPGRSAGLHQSVIDPELHPDGNVAARSNDSTAERNKEKPEEVTSTVTKEPVENQEEKSKPSAAQPKPQRHPPEVKPKPKRFPRSQLNPPSGSAQHQVEDKEMATDQQGTKEALTHFPGKKHQLNQQHGSHWIYPQGVEKESIEVISLENKSHSTSNACDAKDKTTEKKPNMTVIITLQKSNTKTFMRNEQDKCMSPNQTNSPLHPSLISIERIQFPDEAGNLSSNTSYDEGSSVPTKNVRTAGTQNIIQDNGSDPVEGGVASSTFAAYENHGFEMNDANEPIIVVLEEPVDVQDPNARLSTIFECEEHIEETIPSKESTMDENEPQIVKDLKEKEEPSILESKTKSKRRFKFKFPQNKLAALSQALRFSTKPGKKTAEEDTKKDKLSNTDNHKGSENRSETTVTDQSSDPKCVKEVCKSAHESIDSLEESIKQLTISVYGNESPKELSPPASPASPSYPKEETNGLDRSLSKRPAPPVVKDQTSPESKRAKRQPVQKSGRSSERKQKSSAHHSNVKSQQSSSGSPEKSPSSQQPVDLKLPSQIRLVTIPQ